MIFAYHAAERSLRPSLEPPADGWIHVSDPTQKELDWICTSMAVPRSLLDHALDVDEIARVDREGHERLIVLRIPHRQAHTIAFGILINAGRVLTLVREENDLAGLVAARPDLELADHAQLPLLVLLTVADRFLVLLRDIDSIVSHIEDRVQRALPNEELHELLRQQKTLVRFTTALASNRIMLDRLRKDAEFHFDPDLLDDVDVELRQASEMASVSSSLLSETRDAISSIISNNLNVAMKALTSLTLLASVPTLISSFYGMNVALPGQQRPWAFGVVAVSALTAVTLIVIVLRRIRWM